MRLQRQPFRIRQAVAIVLALLACAATVHADDTVDRPVTKLALAADPRFSEGKVALMQGVADADGYRFELPDTDLMQPITVDVYTKDAPAGAVRLRVGKGDWEHPARDGVTDASGHVGFRFRTYDGVKFWVSAETTTPYQIAVWSGTPLVPQPPPITAPMTAYVERHPKAAPSAFASLGSGMRYAIGGAMALLLLVIAVFALRRRKSSGAGA